MILEEIMVQADENKEFHVFDDEFMYVYNGRDSIPVALNNREVNTYYSRPDGVTIVFLKSLI